MSHMPSVLLQKSGVELRAFLQTLFMRLHRLLCSSQSMPIYKVSMEESRWGAVFPATFLPVLMIRVKCSLFKAKATQFSGHLPVGSPSAFNSLGDSSTMFNIPLLG